MKKVLVTGATGFIGNYVVEQLLKLNYNVVATSSSIEKASSNPWFNKVNYIEFDLKNFDKQNNYFHFFSEPDFLIHLAWEGLPNYKSDFHITENYPRHLSLLNNLLQNGLKDITVTGTCFEYGMQEGRLLEDMEPRPGIAYAKGKNELRKNLQIMCISKMVPLKWVRLFYMYGKGQHPNSLISQLKQALAEGRQEFNMSGGEQQRDFLPVQTVAQYIVKIAMQNLEMGIINCCSGRPVKVKDFVIEYLKQHNKNIHLNLGYYPYTDFEPMSFWGDDTKLKSIVKK